ncbi:MAG: hypothetical protein ACE5EY_02920 [Anaerolineae bacterium]
MRIRRGLLPVAIAISVGLLTLVALLFPLPEISDLILGWAGFLAAIALLIGVLNLFAVHINRLIKGNVYSLVLVLSMILMFVLAITDSDLVGLTDNALTTAFNWVLFPLESALAALLAFFLLFSGFQLFKRQRNVWSLLFLVTAVLMLLSNVFTMSGRLPQNISDFFIALRNNIQAIVVTAGMRGILIGVALGTITLSIRLLTGVDRPYNHE